VQAFLAEEMEAGTFSPHGGGIDGAFSAEFSRKVGAKGWIGMTWPKKYGGRERSFLERYVVTEEFRVANAPVRLHFVADRQSGPVIIKYGSERIKADILPRICKGEVCFAIGMSEPSRAPTCSRPAPRPPGRMAAGSSTAPRCGPATPITRTT
jgi:alkylation response protein AidB-like acyl-CoA dehydrogenase